MLFGDLFSFRRAERLFFSIRTPLEVFRLISGSTLFFRYLFFFLKSPCRSRRKRKKKTKKKKKKKKKKKPKTTTTKKKKKRPTDRSKNDKLERKKKNVFSVTSAHLRISVLFKSLGAAIPLSRLRACASFLAFRRAAPFMSFYFTTKKKRN